MTVDALAKAIGGDVKVGFTVVIRTNDGKKAPSMPTFLYVKPAPVIVGSGATASTTTSGAAITVEAVEGGLKLTPTGGAFQYEKSPDKWVTITAETTIKTSEKSVNVRTAPVKEDLKKDRVGVFASNEVTITAPAAPSTGDGDETGGNTGTN